MTTATKHYQFVKFLNALMALVIMVILLGSFYKQFVNHKPPCPLCLLQRLGMIGVVIGNLMNLKYGIKTQHYAISLFNILMGGTVALRQISMHICPGSSSAGMVMVSGLSLATWSFIIFMCSFLAIIIFLFLYTPKEHEHPPMNFFDKLVSGIVFVIVFLSVITTFIQCGFGFCER